MPHRKRKMKNRDYAYEFSLICLLARRCDAEGVRRILRRGVCIALRQNLLTPVMLMAMEGNDRAVKMLIHQFDAPLDQVVEGYARVGRHEKVNELLAMGASVGAAGLGYLYAGLNDHAVDCMIKLSDLHARPIEETEKYRQFLHEHIHEFKAEFTESLIDIAKAGRDSEVEARLANGEDINDAMFGYAAGGHMQQVDNLAARGASRNDAMRGFAASGLIDYVIYLHKHHKVPLFFALKNFASASLHQFVDQLYQTCDYKHSATNEIVDGYRDAEYFSNEKIALRLLVLTRDDGLRATLAKAAETDSHNPGRSATINAKSLLKKSEKIRKIMQEFHLNYDQALALTTPGLLTWLLQGQTLKISRDMHLHIATVLANTSYDDIKIIAAAVAKTTYEGTVKNIEYKHAPGFFQRWGCCSYDEKIAQKKVRDDVAELGELYQTSGRRIGALVS